MLSELRNMAAIGYGGVMGMLEKRVYQRDIPDFRMKRQASFWLYALRGRWELSRAMVSATKLPETMSRYVQLFQMYDDVADSLTQIPSKSDVKRNEYIAPLISAFARTVCSAPLDNRYKHEVISLVNAERYRQYDLQAKYGYSQSLSFSEVLDWREQASGYLTATSAQMAALFIEREHEEVLHIGRIAYFYGANLQLFDDIVDIHGDITAGTVSTMTAALRESGEYSAIVDAVRLYPQLSYTDVINTAPLALKYIQHQRSEYLEHIMPNDRLRLVHPFAEPSSLPVLYAAYQSMSQR